MSTCRYFYSLLAVTCLFFLPVYGQSERTESADGVFSVILPAEWEMLETDDPHTLVAMSPQSDQFDFFQENLLIASFGVVEEETLTSYFEGNLVFLKRQIPTMGNIQQNEMMLDGQEAIRLDYVATVAGNRLVATQIFVIREGRGFIFTLMALEQDQEVFAEQFEELITSFRFE